MYQQVPLLASQAEAPPECAHCTNCDENDVHESSIKREKSHYKTVYCIMLAIISLLSTFVILFSLSSYNLGLCGQSFLPFHTWVNNDSASLQSSTQSIQSNQSTIHSQSITEPAHLLRLYQYPISMFNLSESEYHQCGQTQYAFGYHGWQEMYAIEYWLTNKFIVQSSEKAQEYVIPLSHHDDYRSFNQSSINQSSSHLKVEFVNDPNQADLFIVPQLITCIAHRTMKYQKQGFDIAAMTATNEYLIPILDHIQFNLPYWNASSINPGANHVFIFSWDKGVCIARDILDRFKHSIKLQAHGHDATGPYPVSAHDLPCHDPNTTIVIPQVSWQIPGSLLLDLPQMKYILNEKKIPIERPMHLRPNIMFMRGTIHSPGDVTNSYSHGVRQKMGELSYNMTKANLKQTAFIVTNGSSPNYKTELSDARLGLCVRGWAPWTGRLQAVMNSDTIPVYVADEIVLPFEKFIDWRLFSMKITEANINEDTINQIVALPVSYLQEKQRQLWIHNQYFSWHGDIRFNAFAMLMREFYAIKTGTHLQSKYPKIAFSQYF